MRIPALLLFLMIGFVFSLFFLSSNPSMILSLSFLGQEVRLPFLPILLHQVRVDLEGVELGQVCGFEHREAQGFVGAHTDIVEVLAILRESFFSDNCSFLDNANLDCLEPNCFFKFSSDQLLYVAFAILQKINQFAICTLFGDVSVLA